MAGDLVLLTGGTGHLGYQVLVDALKAGYHVRAAVRSSAKADSILAAPSIKALNPGSKLTFITVPDIIAPGAYDEAVQGVKYVIHIASPITSGLKEDFEAKLLEPALKGTMGMFDSAAKSPSVKRIVITSSIVGVIPFKKWAMEGYDPIFSEKDSTEFTPGPYAMELQAYCASKVQALHATHDYVKAKHPSFDVINLMPSFIVGKNELCTSAEEITKGTNSTCMGVVLGKSSPMPRAGSTVHVEDIGKLHVLALDPKVPGNQDYVASSNGPNGNILQDATKIVEKHFPQFVADGTFPNNGTQGTKSLKIDSSTTEKVFGIKFQPWENQVTSVAQHYLHLLGKA